MGKQLSTYFSKEECPEKCPTVKEVKTAEDDFFESYIKYYDLCEICKTSSGKRIK